jgi:tetratricopeptide (TPR) repeat protein
MRRLEALRYDDGSGTSAPSVAAAFELSYRQLNDITARVFRMLPVNPGPEVSTAAVATLADLPVSKARAEISHLVRAHLVEAAAGAEGRWRMHDLLRLYATQISDQDLDHDGRELARDRLLTYYVDMSHAADGHLRARPGTEVSDIFKGPTDALTWLDVERPNLVAAINVASRTGRHTVALRLPLNLTEYFIWRRRLDDLIAAVTVSIEAARHLGDRGNEAKARDIFGGALRTIGSFEKAMTAHGDAAAIFQEIGDRHGEAVALNSLGDTLWASRENIKAGAAFADAALIFREIGDLEAEGLALGNLCMVIGEDSYYDEAITQEQDMAAIFRKAGERYSEGRAFRRIGELLWMAWRFTEAIVAFRNAADIFEEIGERYDKGVMLYRTGQALERTNRDEEAIIVYRDAAATFEEIDKRYNKGMTLYRTGQALERTNRHVEAITVYRDAAATFEEIDERCNKAIALECLGDVLYKKKRFTEAIVAHREAAVIFQEAGEQSLERKVLAKVRRNERALKDPPKGDDKAKAKKAKSAGGA